jgi:predicted NUDIX family NTP pyrophosphohydrolase
VDIQSAGILVYRRTDAGVEVLLVHPGGPFWARKDEGAWSIPKGLPEEGEDLFGAAHREFREETGLALDGEFVPLGSAKQPGGKIVRAWAVEADPDLGRFESNTFALEWPPKSGRVQEFPEVDKADWFPIEAAGGKILQGQRVFLDRLLRHVEEPSQ